MLPAFDLQACTATAWQATPDLPLRGLIAAATLGLAGWASARRFFPGQRSFVAMTVVIALWISLSVTEHAAVDPSCKGTLALLAWPVVLAQPMLWTLFLYQYLTARPDAPPLRTRLLLTLPTLVVVALCWTNGWHGALYGPATALTPPIAGMPRLRYDYGPVFLLALVVGYLWLAASALIVARGWRSAPASQRGQWAAFGAIMVVPVLANLAYVGFGWRLLGVDPTSTAFAASMAGFAWMIARNRLFAVVPLARRQLFVELPDPVLVLDTDHRVVDANQAAQRLIGFDPPSGTPLATLPRLGAPLALRLDQPASPEPMELAEPQAYYTVQRRVLDRRGRRVGALVQLHDVTALQRSHDETMLHLAAREIQLGRATALQALLREQAMHDPLTGLLNRRALAERYQQESRDGHPRPLTLVLMDLDHFKRINDTHGHAGGDAVLRDFGAALRSGLRAEDALFRIGGEEFALLLPALGIAQALRRVQELRAIVARWRLGDLDEAVTFSAGVAECGAVALPLDAVLAQADRALYRAKQAGRNRTEVTTA